MTRIEFLDFVLHELHCRREAALRRADSFRAEAYDLTSGEKRTHALQRQAHWEYCADHYARCRRMICQEDGRDGDDIGKPAMFRILRDSREVEEWSRGKDAP